MGNSMQGGKLFIVAAASTAVPADAAAAATASTGAVEIKGIGNMGEIGTKTNGLSYPTWGDTVTQKAKGMANAGDPTLEVMRDTADAGQDALRAAAMTNLHYLFKLVRNDKLTTGGTGSVIYMRGLVSGPTRPQGGNEDFDVEVFTLMLDMLEIVVDPT